LAQDHRPLAVEYAAMTPPMPPEAWHLHDPSRIVTLGGWQVVVVTGKENADDYLCGLESWRRANNGAPWQPHLCLFRDKPAWIAEELPDNDGAFWAPDLAADGTLVYSVANGFEESGSCVGAARWDGVGWRDIGAPLTCAFAPDPAREIEAIDPALFQDGDRLWLVTGGGLIHATELDRQTLMPVSGDWWAPDHPGWHDLAIGPGAVDDPEWVEASMLHRRGDWVYLVVNWGACCEGLSSTYELRIGRARSVEGPFLDREGRDMRAGGGSLLMTSQGAQIGPGHAAFRRRDDGADILSYHFYDAERDGLPWIGEALVTWEDGWPVVTRRLPLRKP
jgi:arabinan endo-1,5-alpha-L-arabinosidase